MQISQLAGTVLILVAVQVVFAQAQYRRAPPQRHWYMVNTANPAVDPRRAPIYNEALLRGGLADDLSPQQKSALTDFLARYFPRLFGPAVAAADPVAANSLPPGAIAIPYHEPLPVNALPYDNYLTAEDEYNVPAHASYSGFSYQQPSDGDRGSYMHYPGRGHLYPPGLAYPLDPYQLGFKKVTA